eukprot:6205792-Pleurochrysis_carterae.AAC.1
MVLQCSVEHVRVEVEVGLAGKERRVVIGFVHTILREQSSVRAQPPGLCLWPNGSGAHAACAVACRAPGSNLARAGTTY